MRMTVIQKGTDTAQHFHVREWSWNPLPVERLVIKEVGTSKERIEIPAQTISVVRVVQNDLCCVECASGKAQL